MTVYLHEQNLQNDPWLKEKGIPPLGSSNAPHNAGQVIWKVIELKIQTVSPAVHAKIISLMSLAATTTYLHHFTSE